jgi:hypothetical protein
LDQLSTALGYVQEQMLQWGRSLDAQRQRLEAEDIIFGNQSPTAALERELAVIQQFAPVLFDQFLAGIDVSTAAGREELTLAIQEMYSFLNSGEVKGAILEGFANIADFTDSLVKVREATDDLANATNDAVSAMLNVPNGFKVARYAWAAQDAVPLGTTLSAPNMDPGALGSGGTVITFNGDIVIDGSKDPENTFNKMMEGAKRKAQVKFGNTSLWRKT